MNYYIQGDAAKADQIKAAFEKKGFTKEERSDIYENNVLFFTVDGDKNVHYCWIDQPYCNIIKTHPDYKELELSVEPKFKVGDSLQSGSAWAKVEIVDFRNKCYVCDTGFEIPFRHQESWHLIQRKPHYDIKNFYAGMPVLARADNKCRWDYSVFSRVIDNECWHFAVCSGVCFTQCIPFNEDTKHLLGTTDMCPEEYINW